MSSLPCYAHRITVGSYRMDDNDIRNLLNKEINSGLKGFTVFSVTERDSSHKQWLEIIQKEYWTPHGVRIMETRSRHHGDYFCWMIMVPNGGNNK